MADGDISLLSFVESNVNCKKNDKQCKCCKYVNQIFDGAKITVSYSIGLILTIIHLPEMVGCRVKKVLTR